MYDLNAVYQLLMPRLRASENLEKRAHTEDLVTKAATDSVTLALLTKAAGALSKGLAYGAGAAIPAGLVGGALIHQAGNESRKTVEDVRNKALQAALGVAAIGGGLYALHRANTGSQQLPTKQASVKEPQTLIEKLATIAFLDTLFEDQNKHGQDDVTRQKAAECKLLNAEHGADILRQLLD